MRLTHPFLVDLGLLALELKDAKAGGALPLWINLSCRDSQSALKSLDWKSENCLNEKGAMLLRFSRNVIGYNWIELQDPTQIKRFAHFI